MSYLDCSAMTSQDAIRLSRRAAQAIFILGALISASTMVIYARELSSEMLLPALITAVSLSTPFFLIAYTTNLQSHTTKFIAGPRSLCLAIKSGIVFTSLLWLLIFADVAENVGSSEISAGLMILASPVIISPLMYIVCRWDSTSTR